MADEKPPEGTPAPDGAPAFDKAAYDAGLQALLRGEASDEPAEEAPPKPEGEGEPDADAKADDAIEDDAEGEGDEDKDPKVAEEGLRKLQKEKRSFEAYKATVLEKERVVVAREERVAKGERELVSFFNDLNATGIEALLRHKLIPEEKMELYGRQLFLLSPAGLKDPRSKAEAEAIRRELAREAESTRAMSRVDKLEKELEERTARENGEKQLNQYVAQLDASLPNYKAKTPLLTKAMEKDSRETKRELYAVAFELAAANGDQFVEPGKVYLAWEKQQRERIARLGFSPPAAAPAGQSKAKTPTAAKKQGHEQNGKGAPPAQEPADSEIAKSEDEYRAELRRRLKQ